MASHDTRLRPTSFSEPWIKYYSMRGLISYETEVKVIPHSSISLKSPLNVTTSLTARAASMLSWALGKVKVNLLWVLVKCLSDRIWTAIAGFRVQSANRYTTGPATDTLIRHLKLPLPYEDGLLNEPCLVGQRASSMCWQDSVAALPQDQLFDHATVIWSCVVVGLNASVTGPAAWYSD